MKTVARRVRVTAAVALVCLLVALLPAGAQAQQRWQLLMPPGSSTGERDAMALAAKNATDASHGALRFDPPRIVDGEAALRSARETPYTLAWVPGRSLQAQAPDWRIFDALFVFRDPLPQGRTLRWIQAEGAPGRFAEVGDAACR